MTNSELKALAREELVKILQSDSDKAFTAKCKLIQLVLTDQLEPPQAPSQTTPETTPPATEPEIYSEQELPADVQKQIEEMFSHA
ncbi:hypothetical protein [Vibrio coralliilyticus]|uniref:hypothetical protein n=1 Tax=Vibrio coralliilyticus TaxID=190893 RepID=UPI000BAACA3F|nr:hypothetical protein [Vibrio coralliilyticus]NOI57795.1 hypothetical protein [Vibrio coralliilyticus]PAT69737.1 hypothetical protein CKA27_02960 [Vibrio coralliilyticus]